jgi:hypothetical protein
MNLPGFSVPGPAFFIQLESEGLLGVGARFLVQEQHRSVEARMACAHCLHQHNRRVLELKRLGEIFPCKVLAFKGSALATSLYQTPGTRGARDVDLLVAPRDLPTLRACLSAEGFQQSSMDGLQWAGPKLDLDLHVHPFGIANEYFPIAAEEFWQNSVPMFGQIRQLTPTYELLIAIVHGSKHAYGRLIWLVDAVLLVQACDSVEVETLISRHQLTGLFDFTRACIFGIFGPLAGVPSGRPYSHRPFWERWLVQKVIHRQSSDRLGRLILLSKCSSWTARVSLLKAILLKPGRGFRGTILWALRMTRRILAGNL